MVVKIVERYALPEVSYKNIGCVQGSE